MSTSGTPVYFDQTRSARDALIYLSDERCVDTPGIQTCGRAVRGRLSALTDTPGLLKPNLLFDGAPRGGFRREWDETREGQVRGVPANLGKDLGHIEMSTAPTFAANGIRSAAIG